jgi:HEPN domain-containing protein
LWILTIDPIRRDCYNNLYYGDYELTDIPRQTEYWVKSAEEDFEVGRNLIKGDKTRHGLFFVNLAVEKMLKACFCKSQNKTPPKIHNLIKLYELAGFEADIERQDSLEALNRFCLEGRYPEEWPVIPDKKESQRYLKMAEQIIEWLKKQL